MKLAGESLPGRWRQAALLLLLGAVIGLGTGAALWFSPVSSSGLIPPRPTERIGARLTAAPAPVIGAPAPDFSLTDLEGRAVRLSELRGTPVIVNFWATWCEPCREELPLLETAAARHAGRLRVLAVESGEPEQDIRSFAQVFSLSVMDVLIDPDSTVGNLYLVRGIPTSFFINSEGIVQFQKVGTFDGSELDSILAQLGVSL